ncbi:MAG TPA: peptidoglycan DD-metalloendopeptidase family protein, partial [Patescibacteria group bacterium]|nr:peptidoglycan DD-metalloendopeptidase family protein [Patescibacteria group bacterium]
MKLKPVYLFTLLAIIAFFLLLQNQAPGLKETDLPANQAVLVEEKYNLVQIEITPNSTYGKLMEQAGVAKAVASAIFNAAQGLYDLSKIRVGRQLNLYYDKQTNELVQLMYQLDTEEELYVKKTENEAVGELATTSEEIVAEAWLAERNKIDYELKEKTVEGILESSLYQWALDNDLDVRAIIDLADAYQWTIDFAIDPKVGDRFKFIYQERYRNGEYVMPGQILAARYINSGQDYRIYYFEETEENQGFFDPAGNSVQRELLKAPIQYKYITSGFTTGLRCLEAYNLCTNHRAIDYAAPAGTPIRAVGDGTVVFAGWNSGGYGYLTTIRHNETFTTNYAHQSAILVRAGQKVKQGEIIGKVGSTGLSTG